MAKKRKTIQEQEDELLRGKERIIDKEAHKGQVTAGPLGYAARAVNAGYVTAYQGSNKKKTRRKPA